jgi:hypothetical protein
MKALRENFVPVAFFALWMAASAYTIDSLGRMPTPQVVQATMDVTVTAPVRAAARASCPQTPAQATAGT